MTDFVKEKLAYLRAVLVEQGFIADNKPGDGPTISRGLQKARDAHAQAIQEVSRFENQIEGVNNQLSSDYGPDNIFLAIKDECFSVDTGEYTYTVCIMGQVTQKSNKDGTNTNLGYPLDPYPHLPYLFPISSPPHIPDILYPPLSSCFNASNYKRPLMSVNSPPSKITTQPSSSITVSAAGTDPSAPQESTSNAVPRIKSSKFPNHRNVNTSLK